MVLVGVLGGIGGFFRLCFGVLGWQFREFGGHFWFCGGNLGDSSGWGFFGAIQGQGAVRGWNSCSLACTMLGAFVCSEICFCGGFVGTEDTWGTGRHALGSEG